MRPPTSHVEKRILKCLGGSVVKSPTHNFGSGHDLRVIRSSLASGSVLDMEPA